MQVAAGRIVPGKGQPVKKERVGKSPCCQEGGTTLACTAGGSPALGGGVWRAPPPPPFVSSFRRASQGTPHQMPQDSTRSRRDIGSTSEACWLMRCTFFLKIPVGKEPETLARTQPAQAGLSGRSP